MSKKLTLFFVMFLMIKVASSQTFTLKGSSEHLPIVNANVKSLNTKVIYKSDVNGVVKISDFQENDFFVITSIGFIDLNIPASEVKGKSEIFMYPRVNEFDPVDIIYYYGKEEDVKDIPNQIEIIKSSEIKLKNSQNSADILQASGNVMVQKSQMGGGSPILRGFEANKVLLVLDGVRMNNAIYRSGHLQNSITIDNNVLKQAEVIFGPGSVIYGSDALGGVLHYRTKDPRLSFSDSLVNSSASFTGRISSANQERTYHFDASVGYKKFGFLTSLTTSEFGDLKMGKNRSHGDSQWGLIPEYVSTLNNEDYILENPDPNIQKHTGYKQYDFLQKLLFAPNPHVKIGLNLNYSTSTSIPRFDRYNDYSNGELKWAEWDYGPQDRLLTSLRVDLDDTTKFFDEAHFILAYQWMRESRIQRRFGNTNRETQKENVNVYSVNTDFQKELPRNYTLNYGLEMTINKVISEAQQFNIETEDIAGIPTRYPDGGSNMQTFAMYVGMEKDLNEKTKLNVGGRYSRNILNASFLGNNFYQLPFEEIRFNNGALTGSLGLMHELDSTWQINAVVSSGYRNPNIDDVGKVREKDGFVIVPNDIVKPEYAYNGEITVAKDLFDDALKLNLTGYYTLLNNAIVTREWQLNGQDSLFIDGEMARITTNVNSSEAFIYGYNFGLKAKLTEDLIASASYNFTYGQDKTFDQPLSHIPPVFGRLELQYQKDKFSGSINAFYSGKKELERYGAGSTDNIVEALEDGTPAWWTLNAYTSFFVSQNIEAQFAVENILDKHYKQFASGISAPGRNFVFAIRATF